MFTLIETGSAIISECGRYRYRLERRTDQPGPVVAFFGVNASTADATEEDHTTAKWHGFCRVNGFGKYIVGNGAALRATDVRELGRVDDPIGPENAKHLAEIIGHADILIPCWGNLGKVPKQWRWVFAKLKGQIFASGKPVLVFGFTKSGDPKHPLMLPYATSMIDWDGE